MLNLHVYLKDKHFVMDQVISFVLFTSFLLSLVNDTGFISEENCILLLTVLFN